MKRLTSVLLLSIVPIWLYAQVPAPYSKHELLYRNCISFMEVLIPIVLIGFLFYYVQNRYPCNFSFLNATFQFIKRIHWKTILIICLIIGGIGYFTTKDEDEKHTSISEYQDYFLNQENYDKESELKNMSKQLNRVVGTWVLYEGIQPLVRIDINSDYSADMTVYDSNGNPVIQNSYTDCIINDSYIYFVNDGDNMQKAPKVRLDGGNIKSIDNGRNFIRK
ncbi:hypothetical protein ACR77X_21545 [Bacteroides salyersiae]|uniref:hypothetical protein n=1 Tax=Bacteroides salyersiae TaxID=291644 RepID=UPI003DA2E6DE